jgi:hypothetical protein
MPSTFRDALVIAATILVTAAAAHAQPPSRMPSPHIRPESQDAHRLLDELIARSPTAEGLVDHLEQSNVIVYVRFRWFATDAINGHIGLASSDPHHRYLIIELACRRTRLQQLETLGHELRHAVEIADATSVTNAAALSQLYRRIGQPVSGVGALEAYETTAAADTGRQVRSELAGTQTLR